MAAELRLEARLASRAPLERGKGGRRGSPAREPGTLASVHHRGHLLPAISCSPHSKPCLENLRHLPWTLQQGCGDPVTQGSHGSLPSLFPSLQAWHLALLSCLFIGKMDRIISVSPECYLDLFINAGNILRILKITAIDHQEIL